MKPAFAGIPRCFVKNRQKTDDFLAGGHGRWSVRSASVCRGILKEILQGGSLVVRRHSGMAIALHRLSEGRFISPRRFRRIASSVLLSVTILTFLVVCTSPCKALSDREYDDDSAYDDIAPPKVGLPASHHIACLLGLSSWILTCGILPA
jgi:hypothetical protein